MILGYAATNKTKKNQLDEKMLFLIPIILRHK